MAIQASKEKIRGCLLGQRAGDSIGLPYEGISKKRQPRLLPPPLRHRLVFGRGMISDDTEHALMTAAALAEHGDDAAAFQRNLLWRMRWWFLRLPGGIGKATGISLIKAWLGFPPRHCGIFSAGNGPAMRAPILGVCLGDDREKLKNYVRLSTELTHKDPKALAAALAIALAAHLAAQSQNVSFADYSSELAPLIAETGKAGEELISLLQRLKESLDAGEDENAFAAKTNMTKGISGYSYHTVPMVLFVWLKYQGDYKTSIEKIIALGGDADTTAAILGGICGAQNGAGKIPTAWSAGIVEYPFTADYCEQMAGRLSGRIPAQTPLLFGPAIFARNMVFLAIVLFHGFRRLLPPY